jgi:hypothetical protein
MQCKARDVSRRRDRRHAEHRFHSLEPSGHALVQEQGKSKTASPAWSRLPSRVCHRSDHLGAKQLVLHRVLHDVELHRIDLQRCFFSSGR